MNPRAALNQVPAVRDKTCISGGMRIISNNRAPAQAFSQWRPRGLHVKKELVFNPSNKASASVAAPGQFGRFYLQEMINSGGMAAIWLATDSDGKAYALRRLHE